MRKMKYLIIALAVTFMPVLASAQTYTYLEPGTGTTWSYTLDTNNNATITGASPALSGNVVIPGNVGGYTVVSITNPNGANATNGIAWADDLTGVSLPSSLTSIGIHAFQICTAITEITIPAGVTTIGGQAFNGCYGLTSVDWSAATGLTIIGGSAFDSCIKLQGDITIPASVTLIGTYAFFNCNQLRSVVFTGPTLDMSTQFSVFFKCSNLEYIDMTSITSPATPISLDRTAPYTPESLSNFFAGISAHTMVYLPNGIPQGLISALPTTDNENYVLNGTCDWFYVQDGCDYYIPKAFNATKATWNAATATGTINGSETTPNGDKTFTKGTYVTANLPFQFDLPTGVTGYDLSGVSLDNPSEATPHGTATLSVAGMTSLIDNYPHILKVDAAATGVTLSKTTIDQTPVPKLQYDINGNVTSMPPLTELEQASNTVGDNAGTLWRIYGTTEHIDHATAQALGAYGVSDGKWQPVLPDQTSYLSALRAFLAPLNGPTVAKPTFDMVFDYGSTTGIGGINTEPTNSVETRIYNMGGQCLGKDLNALPKGLYIVNGKKVIK